MNKIAIIGAGSWGTALGQVLADNGHRVMIYGRDMKVVTELKNRRNQKFFGELVLSEALGATILLEEALQGARYVLLAVPTKVMREVLQEIKNFLVGDVVIINASKGIEPETHKRMSEVVGEVLGNGHDFIALSGPSHAEEVIVRQLTSVTCAGVDESCLKDVQQLFSNDYFRVYRSIDLIGVEIGGAIKNVIALGSGILSGLGFGDNAKAALVTRGLVEIKRLGNALGAAEHTFMGLSGLGDLIVTAMSEHSRNYQAGYQIGKNPEVAIAQLGMTVEGIRTCQAAYELSHKLEIDMPIVHAIYQVVFEKQDPQAALLRLMQREIGAE